MQDADTSRLIQALEESAETNGLQALARRVSILAPMDRCEDSNTYDQTLGFRHPTNWGVLLTWNRNQGFANTGVMTHDDAAEAGIENDKSFEKDLVSSDTPEPLFFHFWRALTGSFPCGLDDPPHDFSIFRTLHDAGMRHYACFRLHMPAVNLPAVVSVVGCHTLPR